MQRAPSSSDCSAVGALLQHCCSARRLWLLRESLSADFAERAQSAHTKPATARGEKEACQKSAGRPSGPLGGQSLWWKRSSREEPKSLWHFTRRLSVRETEQIGCKRSKRERSTHSVSSSFNIIVARGSTLRDAATTSHDRRNN